jgi:hypothetical protein
MQGYEPTRRVESCRLHLGRLVTYYTTEEETKITCSEIVYNPKKLVEWVRGLSHYKLSNLKSQRMEKSC